MVSHWHCDLPCLHCSQCLPMLSTLSFPPGPNLVPLKFKPDTKKQHHPNIDKLSGLQPSTETGYQQGSHWSFMVLTLSLIYCFIKSIFLPEISHCNDKCSYCNMSFLGVIFLNIFKKQYKKYKIQYVTNSLSFFSTRENHYLSLIWVYVSVLVN